MAARRSTGAAFYGHPNRGDAIFGMAAPPACSDTDGAAHKKRPRFEVAASEELSVRAYEIAVRLRNEVEPSPTVPETNTLLDYVGALEATLKNNWKKHASRLAKKECSRCKQPRACYLCSHVGCYEFLDSCEAPHSCANALCAKKGRNEVWRFCAAHEGARAGIFCEDCIANACGHCGKSGKLYPCSAVGCTRFLHIGCSREPVNCPKHARTHGTYFHCPSHAKAPVIWQCCQEAPAPKAN